MGCGSPRGAWALPAIVQHLKKLRSSHSAAPVPLRSLQLSQHLSEDYARGLQSMHVHSADLAGTYPFGRSCRRMRRYSRPRRSPNALEAAYSRLHDVAVDWGGREQVEGCGEPPRRTHGHHTRQLRPEFRSPGLPTAGGGQRAPFRNGKQCTKAHNQLTAGKQLASGSSGAITGRCIANERSACMHLAGATAAPHVRNQVAQMQRHGWIFRRARRSPERQSGPHSVFSLSRAHSHCQYL